MTWDCPECGRTFEDYDRDGRFARLHRRRDCAPFGDPDGGCPMCGEVYEAFLNHLRQCPARDREPVPGD